MKKVRYIILLFIFILAHSPVYAGHKIFIAAEDIKEEKVEKSRENEGRLAEISKRKEEMRLELEKMIKEEEKLREDIKKEGRLMPIRKKRDLEQRSKELAEKINRFNEELDKLVQEERQLLGGQ